MPCIAENRLVLVISAATIIYLFIWLWTTTTTVMRMRVTYPPFTHHFNPFTDLHIIHARISTRHPSSTFLWRKLASAWLVNKLATKTRHRFLSIAFTSAFGREHRASDCANQLVQGVRWRQLNVACSSLISAARLWYDRWNGSITGSFLKTFWPVTLQAKRTFGRGVTEDNPEPERPPQAVLGRPGGVVPV